MGMDQWNIMMEDLILVTGKLIKETEKESINGLMETPMMVTLKNGNRDGKGIFKYANGNSYDGDWKAS